jgi:hypothetical protein
VAQARECSARGLFNCGRGSGVLGTRTFQIGTQPRKAISRTFQQWPRLGSARHEDFSDRDAAFEGEARRLFEPNGHFDALSGRIFGRSGRSEGRTGRDLRSSGTPHALPGPVIGRTDHSNALSVPLVGRTEHSNALSRAIVGRRGTRMFCHEAWSVGRSILRSNGTASPPAPTSLRPLMGSALSGTRTATKGASRNRAPPTCADPRTRRERPSILF